VRFTIEHLVDEHLVAECGFDAFAGFFVEIFDTRRSKPMLVYDRMQPAYDHARPLDACLRLLEAEGFIVCLEDALIALADGEDVEALDSGVRRTIEIVMMFKRAAD
jgi:hypothetical protein